MKPLFFSTFMYSYCKVVGSDSWPKVLEHEFANLDVSAWPGFRTLGQASRITKCEAFVDAGTYITRSRCVAAGHFLRKEGAGSDIWLTCDDDVYADKKVIERLVMVCEVTRGLVATPYMNRDGKSMTFRFVRGPTEWIGEAATRTVDRVGMGLVAMHRHFVETLDKQALHFEDEYPFIFAEGVKPGGNVWVGEDYWLCELAEQAGLPMHVLLDAPCDHAGQVAKLDTEGRILVLGDDRAARLQAGLDAASCAGFICSEEKTRKKGRLSP